MNCAQTSWRLGPEPNQSPSPVHPRASDAPGPHVVGLCLVHCFPVPSCEIRCVQVSLCVGATVCQNLARATSFTPIPSNLIQPNPTSFLRDLGLPSVQIFRFSEPLAPEPPPNPIKSNPIQPFPLRYLGLPSVQNFLSLWNFTTPCRPPSDQIQVNPTTKCTYEPVDPAQIHAILLSLVAPKAKIVKP